MTSVIILHLILLDWMQHQVLRMIRIKHLQTSNRNLLSVPSYLTIKTRTVILTTINQDKTKVVQLGRKGKDVKNLLLSLTLQMMIYSIKGTTNKNDKLHLGSKLIKNNSKKTVGCKLLRNITNLNNHLCERLKKATSIGLQQALQTHLQIKVQSLGVNMQDLTSFPQ